MTKELDQKKGIDSITGTKMPENTSPKPQRKPTKPNKRSVNKPKRKKKPEAKKESTSVVLPVKEEKKPTTEIIFKRNFYNFGEIVKGDTIDFKYSFTNMGTIPLIIKDATATCGCTLPEFPKEAIAPGQSGEITGMYISTNKKGPQNAMVKIVANTDPPIHKLVLEGKVLLPEEVEKEEVIEEVLDSLKN